MPAKSVAIVAAMARELAPLLRGIGSSRLDGITLYELNSAVVAVSGIGRSAAQHAAEVVIAHAQPEMLVSAGVTGALRSELKIGDVVLAREVIDAESGARFASMGDDGVVLTADSISGDASKRALRERFNADVVDMEAAAVASVAFEHNLEFAALKAVSDEVDFAMPPVGQFVGTSGQFATAKFVAHIALRPRWWPAVRALGKNTKIASMNLSCALEHLINKHIQATREENVSLG